MTETYNIDCMEYMKTLPDKAFAKEGDRILDTVYSKLQEERFEKYSSQMNLFVD